jgi:hypothetical protein
VRTREFFSTSTLFYSLFSLFSPFSPSRLRQQSASDRKSKNSFFLHHPLSFSSFLRPLSDPRATTSCVCKDKAALYRSKDANTLCETLEVDFSKEAKSAAAREGEEEEGQPLVIHASRVIGMV